MELLGDANLVRAVLDDPRSAPLGEPERALLDFIEKVNLAPASVQYADVEALHRHGWNDEAIYDAVTVCALFNFFNRWVDATGVHVMSPEGHQASGKRLAEHGYVAGAGGAASS